MGGIPSYEDDSFHRAIERWVNAGKFVIMTTQVTNEGSNMSVYEIGKTIKKEFGLLEAYDMTLEATVTKLMWILGQTHEPGHREERCSTAPSTGISCIQQSGKHKYLFTVSRSGFPELPEAGRGRTAF